jgi:folate-binding protein YgfZ
MHAFWCEARRDVLMVEGPDALDYLHSQLSQDLRPLAVGHAVPSLVLDPTGKVVALVRVLRSGDAAYVVDVDAGFGEVLAARLQRFKIRVRAEISTIPWRCLAVRATDGTALELTATQGAVVVPAWWGDGTALDLVGPAPRPPEGIPEGTPEALEVARVAAGWPAMGAEIVPGETIPAGVGVVPIAVSFTKGCYPGQELVERMDSRGAAPPRSLRRIEVPPSTKVGDAVHVDGREVGVVTSVAGQIALAWVQRGVELGRPVGP